MKKALLIGVILLFMNTILGLLLSCYPTFNVCLNSVVILITLIMIAWVDATSIKDGFRVSLTYVLIIMGALECFIGLFAKSKIIDNWVVMTDIVLTTIALILIILTKKLSKDI